MAACISLHTVFSATDSSLTFIAEENPDVFKDLKMLFGHLRDGEEMSEVRQRLLDNFIAGFDNTIIMESKPAKCKLQPFNFVAIPEYDENLHINSIIAAHGLDRGRTGDDMKDRALLLHQIFGVDALTFYERHMMASSTTEEPRDDPVLKLDMYLVGLIGILSELRHVVNVPIWIAAGGLKPDIEDSFTHAIASKGWFHVAETDSSSSRCPPPRLDIKHHRFPSQLPADTQQWYQSPIHLLYWLRRGLVALDARGIELDHRVGRR